MQKIPLFHILFIQVVLSVLFIGCKEKNTHPDAPTITVSIEPLRFFTEQIAGNRFHVTTLVPKGSNPETYEPTPQQLISLSDSKAYLLVGDLGFERTWVKRIAENAPDLKFFNLSQNINLLKDSHHHDGHTHTGTDPHTWTSPKNAQIIAKNICDALCSIDSTGTIYYQKRLKRLDKQLEKIDLTICHELEAVSNRTFMIYHPALGYFARDYGLQQVCIEEGGKEPSPSQLKNLIRNVKNEKVGVVFVQQEFSSTNAELIARETGARIVRINPLSYHWSEEIIQIARALKNE